MWQIKVMAHMFLQRYARDDDCVHEPEKDRASLV